MSTPILVICIVGGIIIFVILGIVLRLTAAYVRARSNGAPVPMFKLIELRFLRIPHSLVVDARITAMRAGIPVSVDQITAHHMAGGNVVSAVQTLIKAKNSGIEMDWPRACAIDLVVKSCGPDAALKLFPSLAHFLLGLDNFRALETKSTQSK